MSRNLRVVKIADEMYAIFDSTNNLYWGHRRWETDQRCATCYRTDEGASHIITIERLADK